MGEHVRPARKRVPAVVVSLEADETVGAIGIMSGCRLAFERRAQCAES